MRRAWTTIDHELAIIEQLGFAGYFLVVWDLVRFCRRGRHLLPGPGERGQLGGLLRPRRHRRRRRVARPAVRALPVARARRPAGHRHRHRERPAGGGHPVRLRASTAATTRPRSPTSSPTGPGRRCATWPRRSATRRASRTPGPSGSTAGGRWRRRRSSPSTASPSRCSSWPRQVEDAPRHLGIHSGGMVICDRPVIEVCPVEWGRMEDRSVLQWDKDDCAAAGLVKFDLLGLGMLSALHYAVDLIREHRGYEVDLATIPQEDEVYDMLCRADTVGVFQIESRAQMATLPRLKPRHVLRPRRRGGADPARADPGRLGAPVHPPAQRPGAGHVPPPAAREQSWARRSACRCSRSS